MAEHPPVRTFKPRRRSLSAARTALFERLGPQFLVDESGSPLVIADVFGRADATVLELDEGRFELADVTGARRQAERKLRLRAVVVGGKLWHEA